ncbi:MAG: haloacid dehalogenase type II [Paraglaciecola sp.]|uniref:haloacid dehalogenase type II n=1 Tax=Paraglaciecola sp. TaxID=1920173 RepID=UPI003296AFBF
MKINIAFDVYGTLIDTQGVLNLLSNFVDKKAQLFSETWRAKQLEYSFRRGLMKRYEHFSICTKDALNYTCAALKVALSDSQKQQLLDSYLCLPAFSDIKTALPQLAENYQLVAFSNGDAQSVNTLLDNAGLLEYFSDVVSADEISTFKPSPEIYQHLLDRVNSSAEHTWLVSSNAFDVIGAKSHGMRAAWVKRSEDAVFDPWEIEPNVVINCLDNLLQHLNK